MATTYHTDASAAALPGTPTWSPARQPAARPDVVVPLLSAGISTLLIAGIPGAPAVVLALCGDLGLAAAAGAVDMIMFGAWIMERNLLRRTLWAVSAPPMAAPVKPVEVAEAHPFPVGAYQPTRQMAEAAWHDNMAWFVTTCYALGKCGEKALVGRQMPDGRRLSENEYHRLVGLLIRARFAAWRNPEDRRQGWAFTPGLTAEAVIAGLRN